MSRRTTSHKLPSLAHGVCLLLVCLLPLSPSRAQNVILHLRNGDRITGRFLSESTNAVVLATEFSDRVTIPSGLVQSREEVPATNAPAHSPLAPASGVVGELVLTNKPSMAQAAGGAPTPAKTNAPPKSGFSKFLSEWRGEAQLGANLGFSSTDREAFTGHMKMVETHPIAKDRALRNILEYDVTYGTAANVLSDDRMAGTIKTEYDLTPRFMIYNAAGGGYDDIQGIDLQYDVGPGIGYKWVMMTNFVFRTELGVNYQEQYFVHQDKTERVSLRLAEDLWWNITPKIRWDEKVEFFQDVKEISQYRVRMETNLSYLLKQNLTMTLNVVDLYDTDIPAAGSKNDLQIRSLLGIKF